MIDKKTFSAHGKFLITGEYAVLDGVPALAVPLRLNQYLDVTSRTDQEISWKSYDSDGTLWFEWATNVTTLNAEECNYKDPVAQKLAQIIRQAILLGQRQLEQGFDVITRLDFGKNSGMGTSSTLISMVADWWRCDPYTLQFKCFGGSGYDIACAQADGPLVYTYDPKAPHSKPVHWKPSFSDKIFFVYLNRKQNSRESIASYQSKRLTPALREQLSEMPDAFIRATADLDAFNELLHKHEAMIATLVGTPPLKEHLFKDFTGAIKSLGGWGGDYFMATGGAAERDYFQQRGFTEMHEWDDLIFHVR